jgi:nucleoside-triphosphatase THEP1
MLGEPGIGKSTAIEDIRDALRNSLAGTSKELVYVNLNEYGSIQHSPLSSRAVGP